MNFLGELTIESIKCSKYTCFVTENKSNHKQSFRCSENCGSGLRYIRNSKRATTRSGSS